MKLCLIRSYFFKRAAFVVAFARSACSVWIRTIIITSIQWSYNKSLAHAIQASFYLTLSSFVYKDRLKIKKKVWKCQHVGRHTFIKKKKLYMPCPFSLVCDWECLQEGSEARFVSARVGPCLNAKKKIKEKENLEREWNLFIIVPAQPIGIFKN